jgi:hypothetical protein
VIVTGEEGPSQNGMVGAKERRFLEKALR